VGRAETEVNKRQAALGTTSGDTTPLDALLGQFLTMMSQDVANTGTKTQRVNFVALDFLRFTTALCVLLFHYELFVKPGVDQEHRWFLGFNRGVDFFFVLSGFIIAHNYSNRIPDLASYARFLRKRLARIYPLHLLTLLIVVAMYLVAKRVGIAIKDPTHYQWNYIPEQLLLLHAWGIDDRLSFNDVSWSISAEWFLYLIFPVLSAIILRLGSVASAAALIIGIVLIDLSGLLGHKWSDATFDFGILRALPSFAYGVILWRIWNLLRKTWTIPWLVPLLLYAAALAAMLSMAADELVIALFGLVIIACALAEVSHALPAKLQFPLELLGNASFGLYMFHLLIANFMFHLPLFASWRVFTAVIATILSVCIAIGSYYVFENPLRGWVGRSRNSKSLGLRIAP
jgi:peptidoglycan/LPS O-acetylase OafA/YrhL